MSIVSMDFAKPRPSNWGGSLPRAFSTTRLLVVLLILTVTGFSFSDESFGQRKYSPDHPEVREMAWKAMQALGGGGGDSGHATLQALAIVECYKRYEERVPKEHPLVASTVSAIARAIDGGGNILHHHDLYYPCLATILLMEVDDVAYKDQIIKMLRMLEDRQMGNGAYSYHEKPVPDTSQTQYAALVFFVARQHRFYFRPEAAKGVLQFYVDYQSPEGTWEYNPVKGKNAQGLSMSLHSASASSVYLLGDLLNLSPRKKTMSKLLAKDDGLPPSVTVYVPPKEGSDSSWDSTGPIVKFNMNSLRDSKRAANQYYENNFSIPSGRWNEYYMYAFERYAFFREQAEGNVGRNRMGNWYDQGVEYYMTRQEESGMFPKGSVNNMPPRVATSLAIMFLVRSSQVLSNPPRGTELTGNRGFEENVSLKLERGVVQGEAAEKSLSDLLGALQDEKLSNEQLQRLTSSMKRAVKEFGKTERSRSETKSFLVNMIGAKNYFRRLVAVRLLAGEQSMDNVPAMLYALGDPDLRIAREAHNGLRLVSRKIDTIQYVDMGSKDKNLVQMMSLKKKWTDWYLKIRPDADLFD